jgi:hypothetical protein
MVEEWMDRREEPGPSPQSLTRSAPGKATPEEVEAYWQNFAAVMELADGPRLPTSWIPGFEIPAPPAVDKLTGEKATGEMPAISK